MEGLRLGLLLSRLLFGFFIGNGKHVADVDVDRIFGGNLGAECSLAGFR